MQQHTIPGPLGPNDTARAAFYALPQSSVGIDPVIPPLRTFTGNVLTITNELGNITTKTAAFQLADSDGVRVGNGGSNRPGEDAITRAADAPRELGVPFTIATQTEVEISSVVQFSDGSFLGGLKGVQYVTSAPYINFTSYIFDEASLLASGHTLADIVSVVASTATNHDLTWAQLGFDLAGGVIPPAFNAIFGTAGRDTIIGTAAADGIRGLAGNDAINGAAGADAFIFGAERSNGVREVDTIRDYQVGADDVVLELGATVRTIVDTGSTIVIFLNGDRDRIVLNGAALNVSDIDITFVAGTFDLL